MTTFLAIIAVAIAVGAWLKFRITEANNRLERDLTAYLLSIPADEWREDER